MILQLGMELTGGSVGEGVDCNRMKRMNILYSSENNVM